MSLKVWEINGQKLELDLSDADIMEKYEKAFEIMTADEKDIPKDGKASERIRSACEMFRKLFANLFGNDAADKIFSGIPTSLSKYEEIYMSFLDFVQIQIADEAKKRNDRLAKYIPNRQIRRKQK